MKHINSFRLFLLVAVSVLFTSQLQAQVGFNNPNPDSSSVIDVKANNKGILIPRLSTAERQAMQVGTIKLANSLMVYDTDQRMFFFFDTVAVNWIAINPWATNGNSSNVTLSSTGNVGIGTTTPTTKLDVNGTINATNYTNNTNGNGPVPAGGIIMWSGSITQIPTGWVLCDGTNGTPDLRDRFIVGAGNNYTVNSTGGAAQYQLTVGQLPSHTHTGTTDTAGTHVHGYADSYVPTSGNGYAAGIHRQLDWNQDNQRQTNPSGSHNHTFTTSPTGSGLPIDNRPPYLALGFIMKVY